MNILDYKKTKKSVGYLAFVFLGFILINIIQVFANYTPMVGWLSLSTTFLLVGFILNYVLQINFKIKRPNSIDVLFNVFIVVYLFIVVFNRTNNPTLFYQHISSAVVWIALYILARNLNSHNVYNVRNKILWIYILTIVLILLIFSKGQSFILSAGINYQGVGLSFLVVANLMASTVKRSVYRYVTHLTSLLTLFMIGSRSELLAYFVCVLVLEFLIARASLLNKILFSIPCFFFTVLILFFFANVTDSTRILSLFDILNDESFLIRVNQIDASLAIIGESYILGKYGAYNDGHYSHNIISAYVDLGLIGVGLILLILCKPFVHLMTYKACNKNLLDNYFYYALSISTLILMLFFKYYTYPLLGLLAGCASCFIVSKRRKIYSGI